MSAVPLPRDKALRLALIVGAALCALLALCVARADAAPWEAAESFSSPSEHPLPPQVAIDDAGDATAIWE